MNWDNFLKSIGAFFSDVGQVFLANIKTAIPVVEQAAVNFLQVIVDAIILGIENGTIPLPALSTDSPVDPLALGKLKRDTAFTAIKAKLIEVGVPEGMVITNSLIYWQIETSVQAMKQTGNGGNFPGGNSNEKN